MQSSRSYTKLALFDQRDAMHPHNQTYEGLEDFAGLVKKRSKTDLVCLIIYVLLHVVIIGLLYLHISSHDLERLGRGNDFRADVCGKVGTTVQDKPYLYYQDPVGSGLIGMCVEECPSSAGKPIYFYDVDGETVLDDYGYSTYASKAIGKICLPSSSGPSRKIVEKQTQTSTSILRRAASDLHRVWDILIIAFSVILILGLVFVITILSNTLRKTMIILYTIGSGCLGIFLVALFFIDYNREVSITSCLITIKKVGCIQSSTLFLLALGILTIFALIWFYFYLFKNRKTLQLVIKKDYAEILLKPIKQISTIIVYVIFQFIAQIVIIGFFLASYIIMMSSGSPTLLSNTGDFPNSKYFDILPPSYLLFSFAFFLFMALWALGNTLLFGKMIVSSAVSTWYFSREKSILDLPILNGLKYTIRYHIGTIALGSILIALFWPLKCLFASVKRRLKNIKDRKSRTFRFWMSTCNPGLTFYEHVLKYISNKNVIQTAIYGEEFNLAGVRVFYLKFRNESRLTLLKNVIGYYLVIGKVFITLTATIITYCLVMLDTRSPSGENLSTINFVVAPPLFVLLSGLFVSQTFSSIFDTVIDTLFFCFICDEEMYSGKQRFAEADIHDFMDKFGKEAIKQDDNLDVRARPHLKDDDDHSNDENAKALLRKEEDDDRNARVYKALNIDDGISDNGGDLTGRSRVQNKAVKKEEAEVDFKGLNFVYVQDKINYEEDNEEEEDEDDDSQEEDKEAKENASRDTSELKGLASRFKVQSTSIQKSQTTGQTRQSGRIGANLQDSYNTKATTQRKVNASEVSDNTKVIKTVESHKSEDGGLNMGIFGMKKGSQDSDLSEDEEDLEINNDKKEKTKQGQKQNFLF